MRSLDQAIARAEAQLRFIPTRVLRQTRLLALLNEQTGSTFSFTQRLDDLGRLIGGDAWPLAPWRLRVINNYSPAFNVLALSSELHDYLWECPPGTAFVVPDDEFRASLLYEFCARPLDELYVAAVPFPRRKANSQTQVMMTRSHDRPPYSSSDLRTLEKICAHFAPDWEDVPTGGLHQPRLPRATEHLSLLDAELHATAIPLYSQALIATFYGRLPRNDAGQPQLPGELVTHLRHHRQTSLRSYRPGGEEDFHHAFTKAHRGRVLCLAVQSAPGGSYRLTCHEDASKHERLRRLKKMCWEELTRDRHTVFNAALALLDDVRDPVELAHRAGITALKPASALRIINRARSIVAAI
jgi:hypothetical protein